MTRHLLVSNDFPPKVGGIQSYLWELWRRLPAAEVSIHTTPHRSAAEFDRGQDFAISRSREPWLLPRPGLVRRVNRLAEQHRAELVVIDPAVPAGLIGPRLDLPYAVVLHGSEVTIPARTPGLRNLLRRVLDGAAGVIAAGEYPASEAKRVAGCSLRVFVIPPGVDSARFKPLDATTRAAVRQDLGIPTTAPTVVSVSRLVPRKGMDTLVRAAALLVDDHPDLQVVIAGGGRDRRRLTRLSSDLGAPVRLLGAVDPVRLQAVQGCADVFAMLCRNRWGGLEQEGFGIVFLEAAACGVAQVAGRSGGADEAVVHGHSGVVLESTTPAAAATAIGRLLADETVRTTLGRAARARVEAEFCYDVLAGQLDRAITAMAMKPAGGG